jgi:hypothetical protein
MRLTFSNFAESVSMTEVTNNMRNLGHTVRNLCEPIRYLRRNKSRMLNFVFDSKGH